MNRSQQRLCSPPRRRGPLYRYSRPPLDVPAEWTPAASLLAAIVMWGGVGSAGKGGQGAGGVGCRPVLRKSPLSR